MPSRIGWGGRDGSCPNGTGKVGRRDKGEFGFGGGVGQMKRESSDSLRDGPRRGVLARLFTSLVSTTSSSPALPDPAGHVDRLVHDCDKAPAPVLGGDEAVVIAGGLVVDVMDS